MKAFTYDRFNILYRAFCVLFSFIIILLWLYRYSLQNIASTSDMKNYYESEHGVQPSFSVCVVDPELDIKIRLFNPNYNTSTYIQFLQGKLEDERLRNLDFDSIRFNWSEYFYKPPEARLESDNGTFLGYGTAAMNWRYYTSFVGLQSYKRYLTYCLAVEPLSKNVSAIKLFLNRSIFENGIRPHSNHKLRVFMHYPGQILRSYATVKTSWKKLSNETRYHMKFRVQHVQVLHRYHKRNHKCLEDWRNYDTFVVDSQIMAAGCRSPYQWSSRMNHSVCSKMEKMKETVIHPSDIMMKQYQHPCRSLEQGYYKYTESDTSDDSIPKGGFRISFYFNTQFKETIQYQQINVQVTLGNYILQGNIVTFDTHVVNFLYR